ncbi:MAG: hypothetical protein GY866_02085 [Proteobacteria bacterium]|nr:hypothetical protein [Pseudomonadota bacterium]
MSSRPSYFDDLDIDGDTKEWTAKTICKAILVDGQANRGGLGVVLQCFQDYPAIVPSLLELTRLQGSIEIDPIDLNSETAAAVFGRLLKICAAVNEVKPGNILFFREAGAALQLDSEKAKHLIQSEFARPLEIQSQIRQLYKFLELSNQKLTNPFKQWIAEVLCGAIIADGVIHPNEIPHLERFSKALNRPTIYSYIYETIRQKKTIASIKPMKIELPIARAILKSVVQICVSDNELHQDEFNYIQKVCRALSIESNKAQELVRILVSEIKRNTFKDLNEKIGLSEQRTWIAAVVFKILYADGHQDLSANEKSYLDDALILLDNDLDKIRVVESDALELPFDELSDVYGNFGMIPAEKPSDGESIKQTLQMDSTKKRSFLWKFRDSACRIDKETSDLIVKYLIEAAISDTDFNSHKVSVIQKVARQLNYNKNTMSELIQDKFNTFLRITDYLSEVGESKTSRQARKPAAERVTKGPPSHTEPAKGTARSPAKDGRPPVAREARGSASRSCQNCGADVTTDATLCPYCDYTL